MSAGTAPAAREASCVTSPVMSFVTEVSRTIPSDPAAVAAATSVVRPPSPTSAARCVTASDPSHARMTRAGGSSAVTTRPDAGNEAVTRTGCRMTRPSEVPAASAPGPAGAATVIVAGATGSVAVATIERSDRRTTRTTPSAPRIATSSRYSSVSAASGDPPGTGATGPTATRAPENSGSTSWTMKTRMPRTLAMIARPPAVTTHRTSLSAHRRRAEVRRGCARDERAGSPSNGTGIDAGSPTGAPHFSLGSSSATCLPSSGR